MSFGHPEILLEVAEQIVKYLQIGKIRMYDGFPFGRSIVDQESRECFYAEQSFLCTGTVLFCNVGIFRS